MKGIPGRSCPLHYRYRPADIAAAPLQFLEGTLLIAGGLYGNVEALQAVLARHQQEQADGPCRLAFNGDFNWFDRAPENFAAINQNCLQHICIQGNVESELAQGVDGVGCGCAYPDYVDDQTVDRSNTIFADLNQTAVQFPDIRKQLAELPQYRRIALGGLKIGVLHGDAHSLAGWDFSLERMSPPNYPLLQRLGLSSPPPLTDEKILLSQFAIADVDLFCVTHTCLPFAQGWRSTSGRQYALINNGSAGMANFAASRFGLITRLSQNPVAPKDSLYGTNIGGLRIDAIPINFDYAAWEARFLKDWPIGSAAHQSYYSRISQGTSLRLEDAIRQGFEIVSEVNQFDCERTVF